MTKRSQLERHDLGEAECSVNTNKKARKYWQNIANIIVGGLTQVLLPTEFSSSHKKVNFGLSLPGYTFNLIIQHLLIHSYLGQFLDLELNRSSTSGPNFCIIKIHLVFTCGSTFITVHLYCSYHCFIFQWKGYRT